MASAILELFRPCPPPTDQPSLPEIRPSMQPGGPIAPTNLLGGSPIADQPSRVNEAKLNNVIPLDEVLVRADRPVVLADLSVSTSRASFLHVANTGPNAIFYGFSTNRQQPPNLETGNGVPIASGAGVILDNIGGLVVWGICTVLQTVGLGTRVTGGFV